MTKTTGQRLVEECLSQMGTTKIAAEYPETVSYLSRRIDQALETANASAVENPVYRIVFADQDVGDHIVWIEGEPEDTKRLAIEAFLFHQINWNCKLMVEIANRPEHVTKKETP